METRVRASDYPRRACPQPLAPSCCVRMRTTRTQPSQFEVSEFLHHCDPDRACCSTLRAGRPVGSKFELVRPYYSAKRAHNVLGHAHFPLPHATRYPSSRMLPLSNCFLGHFEAVVLRMRHYCARVIYCERSFPKPTLRRRRQSVLFSSPNRNVVECSYGPVCTVT